MTYTELRDNLLKRLSEYHPSNDFSLVERACEMALAAHGEQVRKSGEPFVVHPLSVAYILADLELDIESIVSGLLHDVIEDTTFSYDDIVKNFSQEIADIVDGVTKLDNIEDNFVANAERAKNYREELQAENYRKMFLAMANDIRVVLIKIADRLHNMRTLEFMSAEKQREKAQETLDIYAPLTHRLGISKWRCELEDLCFRYLEPEEYTSLAERVKLKQAERQSFVQDIVANIHEKLDAVGIHASVEGRDKHFFSIYKKMKSKGKAFDQIYDLFAVRVFVDGVKECYEVLGVVHDVYNPVPGTFKDYIGMPKENQYQSLHTVIMPPDSAPVEVQIRTWDMHKTAEFGIAAHWKYKTARDGGAVDERGEEKLAWLRQILDWQRGFSSNREFMAALKTDLDVFTEHVYCFTPRGEIISMIRGANCIDFAYRIHSAVGNKMVGARVNGVMVPIDHALNSGDQVDIITSNNSRGPSRDWLKSVKTSQARLKIQQWFKKVSKEDDLLRGRDLLERDAREKGLALSDLLNSERRDAVLNRFGFNDWDTLCASVGHGGLREGQIINRMRDDYMKELERNKTPEMLAAELLQKSHEDAVKQEDKKPSKSGSGILIKGVGDIDVRLSKCCTPVPGDEIIGFITRGRGMSIHRTDCINILNLSEIERHRLLEAEWNLPAKASPRHYIVEIRVKGEDRPSMLLDISRVLDEEKIPVKSLNARTPDGAAIFDLALVISSREQLEYAKNRLMNIKEIHEVERVMI